MRFPSIWQHIKALTLPKITFIAVRPWSRLGGPAHKGKAFTQPLSKKENGFLFQNLKLHDSGYDHVFGQHTTANFG